MLLAALPSSPAARGQLDLLAPPGGAADPAHVTSKVTATPSNLPPGGRGTVVARSVTAKPDRHIYAFTCTAPIMGPLLVLAAQGGSTGRVVVGLFF